MLMAISEIVQVLAFGRELNAFSCWTSDLRARMKLGINKVELWRDKEAVTMHSGL